MIRYAGVYSGPSYGNPWAPSFEGFTSLDEAVTRFRERQETSGGSRLRSLELSVDSNGTVIGTTGSCTYWPATSPQDTLEIYRAFTTPGGVTDIAREPFMRLSAGPRGGVVRERF